MKAFKLIFAIIILGASQLIEAGRPINHRQNLFDPLYAYDDIDAHTVTAGNSNQVDNGNQFKPLKRNLNTRDFQRPSLLDSIDDIEKKPTELNPINGNNKTVFVRPTTSTSTSTTTTTSVKPTSSSSVHYAQSTSPRSPQKHIIGSNIAASASSVDQVTSRSFAGKLEEKPQHWSALENYYQKLRKAQVAPNQPSVSDLDQLQQLLGPVEPLDYGTKQFRPPVPIYVGKSSSSSSSSGQNSQPVRPNIMVSSQTYPSPFSFPIEVQQQQQQQQPPAPANQQASAEPSFGLQAPHERILATSRRPWPSPYEPTSSIGANPIMLDPIRFLADSGIKSGPAPPRMPVEVQQLISAADLGPVRNDSQFPFAVVTQQVSSSNDLETLRRMLNNPANQQRDSNSNSNSNSNNVYNYGTTQALVPTTLLNRPLINLPATYDRLSVYRDFIQNEKKRREHKQALLGPVYNQDQDYESALEEFYCLKNEVNLMLTPQATSLLQRNATDPQTRQMLSSSEYLARVNLNEMARLTDMSNALMPMDYPSHMGVYNGTPPNFSDDNYLCAASWVHERFALTLASCLLQATVNSSSSSLAAGNATIPRLYVRSNEWAAKGGATNRTLAGSQTQQQQQQQQQQRTLADDQLARSMAIRQIKAYHIFPKFFSNGSLEHNLALLEFSEPIDSLQSADISPACQKHSRSSLRANSCWTPVRDVSYSEYFDADGEGETKLKRQVQMRQVPVKLVANDENKCREQTGQDYYIYNHPNYICSTNIRLQAGKWRLLPLNQSDSFGSGIYCQENGRLSLVSLVHPVQFNNPTSNGYLDLSYYKPWIRSIIGGRP